MEELIVAMKKSLSDSFAFYLKAQGYHWNVEGDDFQQYHEFFGNLYEEVYSGIDCLAEQIRTLDAYPQGSLSGMKMYATIEDEIQVPVADVMLSNLFRDNKKVIDSLTEAYKMCERFSEFGASNFLQDRITAHKKHEWMLRSFLKDMD